MANNFDVEGLKAEIKTQIINNKATATPITIRLAWHASGTYNKEDGSGGSNGATMRFEPESADDANKGLSIVRDLLLPIKQRHPGLSFADLWTLAGAYSVELAGGPKIPHRFGRVDHPNGSFCPAVGRLPDAAQGAQHLRDVFYRMGFNDREIVALSGAHTLGRCHIVRSGFDGPWTTNPLRFDNEYFRNLLFLEWRPKQWDGPLQFEDVKTGKLMMLPTDMALVSDPEFRKYVEIYAKDETAFFDDFAKAFSKLLENGCPFANAGSAGAVATPTDVGKASAEFREASMHGSVDVMRKLAPVANTHEAEQGSKRTALHKAAFWGHIDATKFLLLNCKLDANAQDANGDTALHDAARFGHTDVVSALLAAGADPHAENKAGKTVVQVAQDFNKPNIVQLLTAKTARL